jgi:hypothetical protein
MSLWLTTVHENGYVGAVGKAGRSALQVIVTGDCLEAGTLCENKDSAAKTRPALDKGTTFCRIPLRRERTHGSVCN